MNCQDVDTTEWPVGPPKPAEVVDSWRRAASSGRLNIGGHVLTTEECQIVETVLELIIRDLVLL